MFLITASKFKIGRGSSFFQDADSGTLIQYYKYISKHHYKWCLSKEDETYGSGHDFLSCGDRLCDLEVITLVYRADMSSNPGNFYALNLSLMDKCAKDYFILLFNISFISCHFNVKANSHLVSDKFIYIYIIIFMYVIIHDKYVVYLDFFLR